MVILAVSEITTSLLAHGWQLFFRSAWICHHLPRWTGNTYGSIISNTDYCYTFIWNANKYRSQNVWKMLVYIFWKNHAYLHLVWQSLQKWRVKMKLWNSGVNNLIPVIQKAIPFATFATIATSKKLADEVVKNMRGSKEKKYFQGNAWKNIHASNCLKKRKKEIVCN